jgi:FkbM family methyltransferase
MILKKFLDRHLPRIAAAYRLLRDQHIARRWRFQRLALGFEMLGKPRMEEGRQEEGELPLFLELLGEVDAFIDIGANCGLFSLAAAQRGKAGVAVEPNAENLYALMENVRRNQFRTIEILPLALSDTIDVMPLFGGQEGGSLKKGWGGIASNYSRLVATNTMDNLFAARFQGKRLLIKMDVEGNEYPVLRGASRMLTLAPAPVWMVEHSFKENHPVSGNPHFYELFELFWQNGYRSFTADSLRREVLESDVLRWLRQGERDFGFMNYLFSR